MPPHLLALRCIFLFHDSAPTELHTLSLHDALPISGRAGRWPRSAACAASRSSSGCETHTRPRRRRARVCVSHPRSEEHTSELQSHVNIVCRLLLEKKKRQMKMHLATHVRLLVTMSV